jgi:hypothetical protein
VVADLEAVQTLVIRLLSGCLLDFLSGSLVKDGFSPHLYLKHRISQPDMELIFIIS